MARKTTTKLADGVVVEDISTATVDSVDENIDENIEEVVEKKPAKQTAKKAAEVAVVEEPLTGSDKIAVVALVPNVRYLDSYTRDYYKWNNVGDVEYMTFETLERMWRNTKAYFRNMWLKPDDNRVIKQFGLEGIYKNYNFLMDDKNYTYENLDKLCSTISDINEDDMKYAVCNKVKNFVATGKVNDVRVIKALGSKLGIDLSSSL